MANHGTDERWGSGCRCEACVSAHMKELARRSFQARVRKAGGKKAFSKRMSKTAKMSHPKNNPAANRPHYGGGRKPKVQNVANQQ